MRSPFWREAGVPPPPPPPPWCLKLFSFPPVLFVAESSAQGKEGARAGSSTYEFLTWAC